jgi:hypothetical protein
VNGGNPIQYANADNESNDSEDQNNIPSEGDANDQFSSAQQGAEQGADILADQCLDIDGGLL